MILGTTIVSCIIFHINAYDGPFLIYDDSGL